MAVCPKYHKKSAVEMASVSRISVGAALVSSDLHAARQLASRTIALAMGSVSMERVCARRVGQPTSLVVVVTRGYALTSAVLGMVRVRRASVSAPMDGKECTVKRPYALGSHNAAATACVRPKSQSSPPSATVSARVSGTAKRATSAAASEMPSAS